jgi:prepilin-type processing-associated H-X9-DG protein
MSKKLIYLFTIVLLLGWTTTNALGGVSYPDPPGGWRYIYTGNTVASQFDAAPDGTWHHYDAGTGGSDAGDWGLIITGGKTVRGSYGINSYITDITDTHPNPPCLWRTCLVERPARVPVFMDCCLPDDAPRGDYDYEHAPPEYDDAGPCPIIVFPDGISSFCINRHDGGINVLFMDWSVRKVGLKELWTLKWHREFNTKNKWTKAGGVCPTDWPEWMRKFKDY